MLEKPDGCDASWRELSIVCRDHYAKDEEVADCIEALSTAEIAEKA